MKMGILLLCAGLLSGCATFSQRVNRLELGMSQRQVERILGTDYRVKAARAESDQTATRMLEFTDRRSNEVVWVFIRNNRVIQYGTPESLRKFPALLEPFGGL